MRWEKEELFITEKYCILIGTKYKNFHKLITVLLVLITYNKITLL